MSKISFIQAGLFTTVQDGGRRGYQSLGMPTAGAMDTYAFSLANALVGNSLDQSAIEATLLGPTIEIDTDCVFAVTGADMGATLNGQSIELNRAYAARAGSVIALGPAKWGSRGYIAFAGGVGGNMVMGSRATYTKAAIGGIDGRKAKNGDTVELLCPKAELRNMALRHAPSGLIPPYSAAPTLRVTPGPQSDYFDRAGFDALFGAEYTVTAETDRMGCRLSGANVPFAEGKNGNIVSDTVAFGSVQIPSGQPIIMMADHQTTGGYAKPCCVISADLPLAAQLKAGDKMRFAPIEVSQAQAIYRRHMAELDEFIRIIEHGFIYRHRPYYAQLNGRGFAVTVDEIV